MQFPTDNSNILDLFVADVYTVEVGPWNHKLPPVSDWKSFGLILTQLHLIPA